MSTYFDVRFKYPWDLRGYGYRDRISFNSLTGFKHFCIGVNPDRTFSYLRIHDDDGRLRMENELSDLNYAALEALILWRLTTPISVLNSMAQVCLGLDEGRFKHCAIPKVFRTTLNEPTATICVSEVPADFEHRQLCLMLVSQHKERSCEDRPLASELLLYTLPDTKAIERH